MENRHKYKRGTYNKADKKIQVLWVSVSQSDKDKIKELSEKLEINYSEVLRQSLYNYYLLLVKN